MSRIKNRKHDHIKISLTENVRFTTKTAGFEKWEFVHNALPELNLSDISTETMFLGKQLSFPFMFSGMTGGYNRGEKINETLSEIAEAKKIAFGTGSMRPLFEDPALIKNSAKIRQICKSIPFIGNIGAVNLFREIPEDFIYRLVGEIQPDALALHLNPLQEAIQPEGDTNFSGILNAIEQLAGKLTIPIIVKETGAGISAKVATKLFDVGIKILDVSGAGGTSWAAVESFRSKQKSEGELFRNWGIPTAECLLQCAKIKGLKIIASGGVTNGQIIGKAIALGAHLAGCAFPILKRLEESDAGGVVELINSWMKQLKICLFLTGSKNLNELNKNKLMKAD